MGEPIENFPLRVEYQLEVCEARHGKWGVVKRSETRLSITQMQERLSNLRSMHFRFSGGEVVDTIRQIRVERYLEGAVDVRGNTHGAERQ